MSSRHVDHPGDTERASYRDCRATLEAASEERLAVEPETAAEIRDEVRKIKKRLGDLLASLRDAGDEHAARALRAALFDLGSREIERERAFGRATGLDPDAPSIPTLSELLQSSERSKEKK